MLGGRRARKIVLLRNDRSPTKTFGDDDKKRYNKAVIKIGGHSELAARRVFRIYFMGRGCY